MSENQEKKIKDQHERLGLFLKYRGLSLREAEQMLMVGNGRLGKMAQNATAFKPLFVEKILNTFPDLNEHFFIDGITPMVRPNDEYKNPRHEAVPISLYPQKDDDDGKSLKFLYAADGTMGMKVRVVPAKAYAGYLRGFADPEYFEDFEYVVIAVEQEHRGTYLGFEVRGDSMVCLETAELAEQSIFPGRIAIGRDLPRHQWIYKLHTHNYDNWVIVHKTEGILIKQIIKHDVEEGIITIHSLNPEYPDEELYLDEVEQIFSVVQIIKKTR
ncbi:S24 family peptidase [Pedobacter nototheniae]|uniref:S24 family peptidase n=1 Tax=Pedobacter nototheniae TaxID=2488994 RepID=UPI00103D0670|nr:S24 family peptidase [Pedobacter nototheniae]